MPRANRRPIKAHRFALVAPQVRYEDLCFGEQRFKSQCALWVTWIKSKAALFEVESVEKSAGLRIWQPVEERPVTSCAVSREILDLDHIGAKLREHTGRVRRGNMLSKFKNPNTAQWAGP